MTSATNEDSIQKTLLVASRDTIYLFPHSSNAIQWENGNFIGKCLVLATWIFGVFIKSLHNNNNRIADNYWPCNI